jgi:hypothetical protein
MVFRPTGLLLSLGPRLNHLTTCGGLRVAAQSARASDQLSGRFSVESQQLQVLPGGCGQCFPPTRILSLVSVVRVEAPALLRKPLIYTTSFHTRYHYLAGRDGRSRNRFFDVSLAVTYEMIAITALLDVAIRLCNHFRTSPHFT